MIICKGDHGNRNATQVIMQSTSLNIKYISIYLHIDASESKVRHVWIDVRELGSMLKWIVVGNVIVAYMQ